MSKHPDSLRQRATALRKKGLSYKEIQEKVPVAKSTLSLWLKGVPLKPEHRERLYTKQIEILSRGPKSQRERRKQEINKIIKEAEGEIEFPQSKEAFRFLGAALYWAEGSKTNDFSIANSDPHLILFMVKWFEEMFGVKATELRAKINMYEQQNDNQLKKFWSDLTGIPLQNFGKSFIKPPNKGYKKNTLYYGTIKITVPKGSDMRHRTFGWIQAALQDIDPFVQSTQRKWIKLTKAEREPVNIKRSSRP